MSIAKKIKKIRISLCLNQPEFARAIGYTKGAVSNWEKGTRKPSMDACRQIIKLCEKNNVELKITEIFEE